MNPAETSALARFARDSEFRDSINASPPDNLSKDLQEVVECFQAQMRQLRSESATDLNASAIEYLVSRW